MKKRNTAVLAALAAMVCACGGCSRSVLNYQVAECIGTLDKYENNEPVETPKMKAEREARELAEAQEQQKEEVLVQADQLAKKYLYEDAIAVLEAAEILQGNETAQAKIAEYQRSIDGMYEYNGDISHLSFTNLIVDTNRAFDGDEMSRTYRETMITLSEFESMLNEMYQSGYILVDLHSLGQMGEDGKMRATALKIPEGKKPFILSIDNLNYSSVQNGDGVATKLALDANGEVAAAYTDEEGHELLGAYDVIPVLEKFLEEHPDFSYRGARGIISLSGSSGIFGYKIEEGTSPNYESNRGTARQIAEKLKEDGWTFACAGYSYSYMNEMSYDELSEDVTKWQEIVGTIIGDTDTIIYPYGAEVDYTTEKGSFITLRFPYVVGLWAESDLLEVTDSYLRQMRRVVTGYVLEYYPGNLENYFRSANVKDAARS